jgi:hypothetical protein
MGWIERLRPRGFEAVLTVESVATLDTRHPTLNETKKIWTRLSFDAHPI